MASFDYLFKFIVIGDSAVGKSCLLLQFTDRRFKSDHDLTIGVEFGARTVGLGEKIVKMQIWDTVRGSQAGQESFRSITRTYYRGAVAALLVFDVTNKDSFSSLGNWLNETTSNANPTLTIVLVGNKTDLEAEYAPRRREVTQIEAQQFAEKHHISYFETSAKTGANVEQCFLETARTILGNIEAGAYDLNNEVRSRQNCGIKTSARLHLGSLQAQGAAQKRSCSC